MNTHAYFEWESMYTYIVCIICFLSIQQAGVLNSKTRPNVSSMTMNFIHVYFTKKSRPYLTQCICICIGTKLESPKLIHFISMVSIVVVLHMLNMGPKAAKNRFILISIVTTEHCHDDTVPQWCDELSSRFIYLISSMTTVTMTMTRS